MDKTIVIAVLTLVVAPIIIALIQNLILGMGKKGDLSVAREEILLKREEALEVKRQRHLDDIEADLKQTQEDLAKAEASLEKARAVWAELDTSLENVIDRERERHTRIKAKTS